MGRVGFKVKKVGRKERAKPQRKQGEKKAKCGTENEAGNARNAQLRRRV